MTEDKDQKTAKRDLRRVMKTRRAEAHAKNPLAPIALRDLFLKIIKLSANAVVAGYAAHDSEIDPYSLMVALHNQGHRLCLPIVGDRTEPLTFRAYIPGDVLIPAASPPIAEPVATAAVVEPDVVLAPLLAFDKRGHRLGWGAGHYDRTLIAIRNRRKILAVGLAFDCQEVIEIPASPHDALLDKVITETQCYHFLLPS